MAIRLTQCGCVPRFRSTLCHLSLYQYQSGPALRVPPCSMQNAKLCCVITGEHYASQSGLSFPAVRSVSEPYLTTPLWCSTPPQPHQPQLRAPISPLWQRHKLKWRESLPRVRWTSPVPLILSKETSLWWCPTTKCCEHPLLVDPLNAK